MLGDFVCVDADMFSSHVEPRQKLAIFLPLIRPASRGISAKYLQRESVLQHFYSSGKTCLMVAFLEGGGGCWNVGCHIGKIAKITKTFGKWLSLHVMNSKFTCMIDFLKGREARRFCVNCRRRFVVRSRGRFSVAVASLVWSPDWPIQFLLLQPISAASKPPWSAGRAGTVSGLWGGEFRRLLPKTRADAESGNPTLLKENNLKIHKTLQNSFFLKNDENL